MLKSANFFITEFFRSLIGKQPAENISPKIAVAIQKQAHVNSNKIPEKSFTPPYLPISYQLISNKQEVFEAAVYYLCLIANNTPKYKQEIANILETYCQKNQEKTERINFIKSEMEKHTF